MVTSWGLQHHHGVVGRVMIRVVISVVLAAASLTFDGGTQAITHMLSKQQE